MAVSSVLAQRAYLLDDLDRRVTEVAERGRQEALGGGPGTGTDPASFDGRGLPVGTISARLDVNGTVVAAEVVRRSGGPRDLGAAQRSALSAVETDGSPHTRTVPGLGTYRVAVLQGGGRPLLTALPMDDVQGALRRLAVVEAATAAAATMVVGCACAAVIRHRLRPLEQVTALATELSRPPLQQREPTTPNRPGGATTTGPARAPGCAAGSGGAATVRTWVGEPGPGPADEPTGPARAAGGDAGPGGASTTGPVRAPGCAAGSGGTATVGTWVGEPGPGPAEELTGPARAAGGDAGPGGASTTGRVRVPGCAAGSGGAAVVRALADDHAPGPAEELTGPARAADGGAGHGGAGVVSGRVPGQGSGPGSEADRIGAALGLLVERAEAADARRLRGEERTRRLLSDASHELRTPLAAVAGYAELMTRGPGLLEPATAWQRVSAESARMTSLVEDLLLLARLDDEHQAHQREFVRLDLAVLAAEGVRAARAAGEGHVWRLGLLPESPALVAGDEVRLRRAVGNLLTNARAHTPAGTTVVITLEATATTWMLRVRDDGPGVPPALLPQVFERFTRADASRSRVSPGHGGSGLGLAVTAAVTKAHHGRVHAESAPGRTEFTVELPALRPPPASRLPAEPGPGAHAPACAPRTGEEATAFPGR
ncbi:HAMP domain-containing sensor histidine kinase [Streptomyces sp. f51]|uniref:sensor histidine kinase n=1 Tax=Streptomyces sp. f51 TaxID=1827742 RepID=UPI0030CF0BCB